MNGQRTAAISASVNMLTLDLILIPNCKSRCSMHIMEFGCANKCIAFTLPVIFLYSFTICFRLEDIEVALSPKEDDYVLRVARHLVPRFSSLEMSLLENVFSEEKDENTLKRSRVTHNKTPFLKKRKEHIKDPQDKTSRKFGLRRKVNKTPKNQRNVVPSYLYDPIRTLNEEFSDINDSTEVNASPGFTISQPLHTMASPQARDLTTGKLDQKVLDLLKRVGLGLVTISDLSLSINANMKEQILRVSGKAAPKKIGGWFNFEVVRKNIFAVAFTAEQAGFMDFTEQMFNTKLGLFNALEQTTVSYLWIN